MLDALLVSGVTPFLTIAFMKYLLALFSSIFLSVVWPCVLNARATSDTLQRTYRLGIAVQTGLSTYHGDLIPVELSFKGAGPAVSWSLNRPVSRRLMLGLESHLATYSGSDYDFDRSKRGLSSTAALLSGGMCVRYFSQPVLRPLRGWKSQPNILIAGGALYSESSTAGLPAEHPDARVLHTSSWYAGVGLGYMLYNWEGWTLGLEIRRYLTGTDYLEGISYAGNPKRNDGLTLILINVGKFF